MEAKRLTAEPRVYQSNNSQEPPVQRSATVGTTQIWQRLDIQEKLVLAHLNMGSVNQYAATIREILQDALKAHHVTSGAYFSPSGHFRYLVSIRAVNTELERLRQALTKPSPVLMVMKSLELIRGLLCDILI